MSLRLPLSILALCFLPITPVYAADAEVISIANSQWHLHWRNSFTESEKSRTRDWLRQAAETTSTLYGELPLRRMTINLDRVTTPTVKSPVPWGETIRLGEEGVRFVVDPSRSLESLINDWTAPHELAHLFLPYLGGADAWLAEGFASYYQNVLMSRGKIHTPEKAWQELYEGFQRAQRDTNNNRTLLEVSRHRRESKATMRVYWSGALFFLQADVALRKLPAPLSLDEVVEKYIKCCRFRPPLNSTRWNGEKLMEAFDAIVGSSLFSELYEDYANSLKIPDYTTMFNQIGIETKGIDLVFLQNQNSSIRDAIMASR